MQAEEAIEIDRGVLPGPPMPNLARGWQWWVEIVVMLVAERNHNIQTVERRRAGKSSPALSFARRILPPPLPHRAKREPRLAQTWRRRYSSEIIVVLFCIVETSYFSGAGNRANQASSRNHSGRKAWLGRAGLGKAVFALGSAGATARALSIAASDSGDGARNKICSRPRPDHC